MKIANPFVIAVAVFKVGARMLLPLLIVAAQVVLLTAVTTAVGFGAGALVDLFHVAPISFKAVGAVVAFVSHVWRAAH